MVKDNVVDISQSSTSGTSITGRDSRGRTGQRGRRSDTSLYVAIVDTKPLTRKSLANLLSDLVPEWRITSCSYPHEMTIYSRSNRYSVPAVVILVRHRGTEDGCSVKKDIEMLKESIPGVPIVILSDADDIRLVLDLFILGASAIITPSLDPQVIIRVIVLVAVGGTYIPPGAIASAIEEYQRQSKDYHLDSMPHPHSANLMSPAKFTPRQLDVLELLRHGLPNKTIAHMLQMQECSVKAHVRQLMQKLGASNRTQVACYVADPTSAPAPKT
jgi:DNA-binding NarL/FixJ family response regulator